MHHVSAEPPAFFRRGPSPLARLAFFGLISLALLFADTRYRYLENLRHVVGIVLYPLQRAAQMPGEALAHVGTYFSSQRDLVDDNAALRRRLVEQGPAAQGYVLAEQEIARLKALLELRDRHRGDATTVEVLYT